MNKPGVAFSFVMTLLFVLAPIAPPARAAVQADRLLAAVASHDAITAGSPIKKIEQAQRFLARGDAEAGDEKCHNGIEHYLNSWRRASR